MSQTTTQPSANDVLMGSGGAATAKFDRPGTTVGGRIVGDPRVYQEREYDPRNPGNGALKFYPKSGDPIMSVSVDVQTGARDDAEDNGIRRIYVEGKRLKDAVRDAVRQAGAKGLEPGGELHVTYTGLGEAVNGMNAPKLYTARYVPASSAALSTDQEPQAAPLQQAPAPVATGASATSVATPNPQPQGPDAVSMARQLIAANLDDETVSRGSGLPIETVLAMRNAPAA